MHFTSEMTYIISCFFPSVHFGTVIVACASVNTGYSTCDYIGGCNYVLQVDCTLASECGDSPSGGGVGE